MDLRNRLRAFVKDKFFPGFRRELLSFHVHDAYVVFAAGLISGFYQRFHNLMRLAGEAVDDFVNRCRVDQVRQAVSAQKQGGIRFKWNLIDVDEVRILGLVRV